MRFERLKGDELGKTPGRRHSTEEDEMPQKAWSAKRERQYEHIKKSERGRGVSTKRAKEIAARTVNKERARSGETKTKEQLYNQAKRLKIHGRSKMSKAQLQRALAGRK
jgi:hypothetical protein